MNLVPQNTHPHKLRNYYERLNSGEKDLFREEAGSAVDFWEFDHNIGTVDYVLVCRGHLVQLIALNVGFHNTCIRSFAQLTHHLHARDQVDINSPRCRFM